MKRILLIITALFAVEAYAQDQLITVVNSTGNPKNYFGFLEGTDDFQCMIFHDALISDLLKLSHDVIVTYSKTNREGKSYSIERNSDFKFLTAYEGRNNLYMLYRRYNSYQRKFEIHLNTIPKDMSKVKWNPKELISFDREVNENIQFSTAVSPDKSKAALLLFLTNSAGFFEKDKTDKLKGAAMLIFEEDKLVMSRPFDFEIENNVINFLHLSVNNDGEAYVALSSYIKNDKDGQLSNETFHLYAINQESIDFFDNTVDFGHISNGTLHICNNGSLAFGGYYSPAQGEGDEGYYLMLFTPSLNLTSISYERFPEDFFSYKHPKASKTIQPYKADLKEILEFDNGTLTMLGEIYTTQYSLASTFYLSGNTLVTFADKSGRFTDFKMLPKHQYTSLPPTSSQLFSYHVLMHNNTIHLFYTDLIANLNTNTHQPLVITNIVPDKKCAVHCTINSEGNITPQEMLINYPDFKCVMLVPLSMDDDGLWFFHTKGLSGAVSKLPHKF